MSISPPLNQHFQILLSGIDSLNLAVDIEWRSQNFFELLDKSKNIAKEADADCPLFASTDENISFLVRGHGAKGYSWLIYGKEYALKIGNWQSPSSRPSVMIEVRSETLWRLSPSAAYQRILCFLESQGAKIVTVKPSRVDLCLDLLMPEELWTMELLKTAVSRSSFRAPYLEHQKLTGIQFGKGDVSARLYDKALEIRQKSNKIWFYDLWKILEVPEGFRAIRVEFQLRRAILKTLGLDTISATFPTLENVWAYCSQQWLSFKDHPEREHHRRPVSSWWESVQNSFLGIEEPQPLIRAKAINAEKIRLARQAYGLIVSLIALDLDKPPKHISSHDFIEALFNNAILAGKTGQELVHDVVERVLKFYRGKDKQQAAIRLREQNGFPCNLPKEDEP